MESDRMQRPTGPWEQTHRLCVGQLVLLVFGAVHLWRERQKEKLNTNAARSDNKRIRRQRAQEQEHKQRTWNHRTASGSALVRWSAPVMRQAMAT